MWMLCLYLMGLNLSNQQIAQELDIDKDVVQDMTMQLRQGIVKSKPEVQLAGAVECDEVYQDLRKRHLNGWMLELLN
jgi:hypothetical protein